MLRLVFIACALIAGAALASRPMAIHQSQSLPAPAGYQHFGYRVAIEGDWAVIMAATPWSPTGNPPQIDDALLYHRVNGVWTLDRTLVRRVWTDPYQASNFSSVAIKNGVIAIGSNPTQIFKRVGNTWTEIAHPFTAPKGHPDSVNGDLLWDGSRLLAVRDCGAQPLPWGAVISRLGTDGSWSPLEHLSSGDTTCLQEPIHWGISGPTVVAGTWTNDFEEIPEQLRIFRRMGTTWVQTSAIDGGFGEGDVRGDEIFFSSRGPRGTLVYRNDDSQTVVDNIRTVTTSNGNTLGGAGGFTHTSDVFVQGGDLFRKNADGKYEHVARLMPTGPYGLAGDVSVNGHRLIAPAYRDFTSSNQEVLFFDLPTTYTPSAVIATGFENGSAPQFEPQLGRFFVTTSATGNHVYRQSSTASDYRALLGDSDWVEQSIEADIRPSVFSGSDVWAGLAVRYLDDANYYYVTLRSSGVVAIKSVRNGVVSTLAQTSYPIVPGRSYRVSLQVTPILIALRIDGKDVMSGADSPLIPHGSAALLGYRTAADYDNVVVAQVGQQSIFNLAVTNCAGPIVNMPVWTSSGTGNWSCSGNTGPQIMQQTSTAGDARALVGTPTDDQVLTTRARATSFAASTGQERWFGIAARYVNASNYYYLTVRNSNTVSLRKVVNGAVTVLGTAPLTVTANTWYDLRLDAVGNELRAFVNGRQVLQAVDASHASGQGGLLTFKTAAEYANYFAWQP